MPLTVGVLALQGGVREHQDVLEHLGVRVSLVRSPSDLIGPDGLRIDALVLPGGESSVIDKLIRLFGLFDPLRAAIDGGLPTLGTCAGLVLMARTITNPAPGQRSLAVLDGTVRRNAHGPQLASSLVALATPWGPSTVAFIRAPAIIDVGPAVVVMATHLGQPAAIRQGEATGLAFHPELCGVDHFHRDLVSRAGPRGTATSRASATQQASARPVCGDDSSIERSVDSSGHATNLDL